MVPNTSEDPGGLKAATETGIGSNKGKRVRIFTMREVSVITWPRLCPFPEGKQRPREGRQGVSGHTVSKAE